MEPSMEGKPPMGQLLSGVCSIACSLANFHEENEQELSKFRLCANTLQIESFFVAVHKNVEHQHNPILKRGHAHCQEEVCGKFS